MLVSVRELRIARKVFDESCVRDLVSWNTMINGYIRNGLAEESILLYRDMIIKQVKPDEVTMIGIVSSCGRLGNLKLGKHFHSYIEQNGLRLTVALANALMDMYVKCADLKAAMTIFYSMEEKTVFSWTTMIVGHSKSSLLHAAKKLFDEMPERNIVAWNAMIGTYVQARQSKEALCLFHSMQANNIEPDGVTMIHCLSACSQLGLLDTGRWIHHYIKKHKFAFSVALSTALMDMYVKCGNIEEALQVFHDMPGRNSLTWTAIVGGLALYGRSHEALCYFSKMINMGLIPDEVTFLNVLCACCHGGLVEEGRRYFTQMKSKFNLSPQLKHYSCMVDLLGRAGLLKEADELIASMPMKPDAAVWGALFFACRIHGDLNMGERAAFKLLEIDTHDSGIYVLLADMYKEANMVESAGKVRMMMAERRVEKTPGSSSIQVDGNVSEFIVGDNSHPQSLQIYECLILLTREIEFC